MPSSLIQPGFRAAAALLAVHVVLAVGSMRQASLTWDEPSYIGVGRQMLETRNPEIVALQLHPPLPYYVNSLLLLPLDFEPDRFGEERYIYERSIGPALIFDSGYAPGLIMFLARIPFVVLSALLGLLVWRWTGEVYGARAGLLATFLYALSPTVLAHCRLATADLLVALTMTLALYSLSRYVKKPSAWNIAVTGAALGLALLSKFTALILIPIFLFIALVDWWRKRKVVAGTPALSGPMPGLVLVFGIAALVVWAGYGFQLIPPFMPQWLEPEAERLIQEKPFWRAMHTLSERGVRVPAYSYLLGVYTQLAAAKGWKDNFLFGHISSSGWWYFYWAAFLIKTPLPLIICLGAALLRRRVGEWKEAEPFLLLSLVPLLVFFSLPTKINIGLRYILPLYPLLFMLAGRSAGINARKWRWALGALCVWYAGSAAWIYPHYLAYFNELVGGPGNGYKYLVDSNLDWGQNLGRLADYLEEHTITDAKIKYFGPPGVMNYYGLENADLNDCEPSMGVWAVSATYLQNLYLDDRHCHDWLRRLRPEKVIGYSLFVYDISAENLEGIAEPPAADAKSAHP